MAKPSLYIETTIPSYLAAKPSRDLLMYAHQVLTREWWDGCRDKFDVYTSDMVLLECLQGDADAARRRLDVLAGIPVHQATDEERILAKSLLQLLRLPERAANDAVHLAIACNRRTDYLLTWNCRHLANAMVQRQLLEFSRAKGLFVPVICTPEELHEPG